MNQKIQNENIIFWKWSKDEIQDKSKRLNIEKIKKEKKTFGTYDLSNFNETEDGKKFPVEYKRETNSSRMAEREQVIQNGMNPFLLKNNYIDDINNQDKYLRGKTQDLPINSID